VVKKALAKLKVEAEWLSDPARSAVEVAAIHAFGELIGPQYVPQVLWTKVDENSFAMRLVDPRLRNWKRDLLDGRVDLKTARRAGELIGSAHGASQQRTDLRRLFADRTYFHQLRVEPFFYKVATQVPALDGPIRSIVEVMETRQSALVHGDYSPKNILADGPEIVILDFEVAHWGDPRFDVGFCASHMILKSYRRGVRQGALLEAVREFLAGYAEQGPDIDDDDLVRITGCLIMARFKGSSPIDYAADIDQAPVLALATDMITRPKRSLPVHLAATPELPW
jgi:5-methylthioribose kinase